MPHDSRGKLAELRELLCAELVALFTAEDWTRLLHTAAHLPGQSFTNIVLIGAQAPGTTMVAGYDAWQAMGRQVVKGEPGIRIITEHDGEVAPGSARRTHTGVTARAAVKNRLRSHPGGPQLAYVWDISQTTGPPTSVRAVRPLERGQPPGLWDALMWLARREGFGVERGYCGQADSATIWRAHRIRVRPDLDRAQAARALAHELGHILLDGSIGPGLGSGCRGVRMVEADSISFVVSARLGMDTSGYSFPYVGSWAGTGSRAQPEATVLAAGERIIAAAAQITAHLDTVLPPLVQYVDPTPSLGATPASRGDHLLQEAVTVAPATATSRLAEDPAPQASDIHRVTAILGDAHRFFAGQLGQSWVPGYLRDRGLDDTVATAWQIGFAPDAWTGLLDHLRGLGHEDDGIEAAGLARRSARGTLIDHFRNRAMLAIRDPHGAAVGFIGRARPGADPAVPKYLNSPETAAYKKGDVLFGLYEARSLLANGAVPVIVEGPFDAIAVSIADGGRYAGVAPCGTALTSRQVAALDSVADLRASGVLVALDGDRAGRDGAVKAYDILRAVTTKLTAIVLPTGRDPAEILQMDGPAILAAALRSGAQPLANLVVDDRLDSWGRRLEDPAGQLYAMRDAATLIAEMIGPQTAAQILQVTSGQKLGRLDNDLGPVADSELPAIARMFPADVAHQITRIADRLGFECYSDVLDAVATALAGDAAPKDRIRPTLNEGLDKENGLAAYRSPPQLATAAFPHPPRACVPEVSRSLSTWQGASTTAEQTTKSARHPC